MGDGSLPIGRQVVALGILVIGQIAESGIIF